MISKESNGLSSDIYVTVVDLFMLISILLICITVVYGFMTTDVYDSYHIVDVKNIQQGPKTVALSKIDSLYIFIEKDKFDKDYILIATPKFMTIRSDGKKKYIPVSHYRNLDSFLNTDVAKALSNFIVAAKNDGIETFIVYSYDASPSLFGSIISLTIKSKVIPKLVEKAED